MYYLKYGCTHYCGVTWREDAWFTCRAFCPQGTNPGTLGMKGWVGLRDGIESLNKSVFCRKLKTHVPFPGAMNVRVKCVLK